MGPGDAAKSDVFPFYLSAPLRRFAVLGVKYPETFSNINKRHTLELSMATAGKNNIEARDLLLML